MSAIPISPPIVIAATPERTFDQWFFTDFHASNISPASGTLRFTKVPMNAATGDTLPEQAVGVTVNLWDAVAAVPEAASALASVLTALPAIEAWKASQEVNP